MQITVQWDAGNGITNLRTTHVDTPSNPLSAAILATSKMAEIVTSEVGLSGKLQRMEVAF